MPWLSLEAAGGLGGEGLMGGDKETFVAPRFVGWWLCMTTTTMMMEADGMQRAREGKDG
jgi:hypothetical protein